MTMTQHKNRQTKVWIAIGLALALTGLAPTVAVAQEANCEGRLEGGETVSTMLELPPQDGQQSIYLRDGGQLELWREDNGIKGLQVTDRVRTFDESCGKEAIDVYPADIKLV